MRRHADYAADLLGFPRSAITLTGGGARYGVRGGNAWAETEAILATLFGRQGFPCSSLWLE